MHAELIDSAEFRARVLLGALKKCDILRVDGPFVLLELRRKVLCVVCHLVWRAMDPRCSEGVGRPKSHRRRKSTGTIACAIDGEARL